MTLDLMRFHDLKRESIVNNRVTLGRWIRDYGFPPGRLVGPNSRVWTRAEIMEWFENRPISKAENGIAAEAEDREAHEAAAAKDNGEAEDEDED